MSRLSLRMSTTSPDRLARTFRSNRSSGSASTSTSSATRRPDPVPPHLVRPVRVVVDGVEEPPRVGAPGAAVVAARHHVVEVLAGAQVAEPQRVDLVAGRVHGVGEQVLVGADDGQRRARGSRCRRPASRCRGAARRRRPRLRFSSAESAQDRGNLFRIGFNAADFPDRSGRNRSRRGALCSRKTSYAATAPRPRPEGAARTSRPSGWRPRGADAHTTSRRRLRSAERYSSQRGRVARASSGRGPAAPRRARCARTARAGPRGAVRLGHGRQRTPGRVGRRLRFAARLPRARPGAVDGAPAQRRRREGHLHRRRCGNEVDSFNPFVGIEAESYEMWALTYDYMITLQHGGHVAPARAGHRVGASEDGLTWTFTSATT